MKDSCHFLTNVMMNKFGLGTAANSGLRPEVSKKKDMMPYSIFCSESKSCSHVIQTVSSKGQVTLLCIKLRWIVPKITVFLISSAVHLPRKWSQSLHHSCWGRWQEAACCWDAHTDQFHIWIYLYIIMTSHARHMISAPCVPGQSSCADPVRSLANCQIKTWQLPKKGEDESFSIAPWWLLVLSRPEWGSAVPSAMETVRKQQKDFKTSHRR